MLPHVPFALSLLFRWLMSAEQFDPSVVSHLTTFRYIHIAVATVRPHNFLRLNPFLIIDIQAWLWDAIISFSTEVDAFTSRRFASVDIAYCSSR